MASPYWYHKSKAAPCPRAVAGRRCRVSYDDAGPCICATYYPTILDHVRMWMNGAGDRILTSEPYDLTHKREVLEQFIRDCAALALMVDVYWDERDAVSPWYPGHTTLIRIMHDRPLWH
jgi:hypothetical protein